ncbi:glycosyltransferase [Arsukibacterium sp.]|uniref:glycosyltransferase n=1 Tax=Arsukibacterium sp. TaxID=1977258 RepID=UPI00299D6B50|nr:glycosyltransferase [Arsukibacterium sp.]MDX1677259.1 glycosyltransferase [Arsukibacterium sp.]
MIKLDQRRVFFICDANHTSGMGHFLRCVSLALQLRNQKYQPTFIGEFSEAAIKLADYYSIDLQLSAQSIAQRLHCLPGASRVILDSYQYSCDELPEQHCYVLIDDFCLQSHYPVAGVINFTYQAKQYDYCAKGASHQALGIDYFLAHPSLTDVPATFSPVIERILILIGSGDVFKLSSQIVVALQSIRADLQIKVVGNQASALSDSVNGSVQYVPVSPNVNQYYQWADFCITSGGLAKYECAYIGKPAAVISLTEAEQSESDDFAASQLCFNLGYRSTITADRLSKDLTNIIFQPQKRLAAYKACLQAFSGHSGRAITEFVTDCWECGA